MSLSYWLSSAPRSASTFRGANDDGKSISMSKEKVSYRQDEQIGTSWGCVFTHVVWPITKVHADRNSARLRHTICGIVRKISSPIVIFAFSIR